MHTSFRLLLAPALLLGLASCDSTAESGSTTALTVNETAVNDPSGPHAILVGIENHMAFTLQAPLCGTPPYTAAAFREKLVDGSWVVSGGVGTCGLADATNVVQVVSGDSKELLRMVVPNEAGSYRFRWSVPTDGGDPVDLTSPTVTVTMTP